MEQKLYLMKNEIGLYKIGISSDPLRRLKAVANSSGISVELISEWKTGRNAKFVESELHEQFKQHRKMGEWFDFDIDELIIQCEKAALIADDVVRVKRKKSPELPKRKHPYFKPEFNGNPMLDCYKKNSDERSDYAYRLLTKKLNHIGTIRSTVIRTSLKSIVKLGVDFNFSLDTWIKTNKKSFSSLDHFRCLFEEVYNHFTAGVFSKMGQDIETILQQKLSEGAYKKCEPYKGVKLNYPHYVPNPIKYFNDLRLRAKKPSY